MKRRDLSAWKVSLCREAAELLKSAKANELPANKRRSKRNGNGCPLSAFMAANVRDGSSKIMAVANGFASYPYTTYGASAEVLADRIAKRYPITAVQYFMLLEHVFARYRGNGPRGFGSVYVPDFVVDRDIPNALHFAANDWLRSLVPGMKYNLPLRLILSERLADLILQYQLCETVQPKRSERWILLN